MRLPFSIAAGLVAGFLLGSGVAMAEPPASAPAPLTLEPAVKAGLILLTDGKGHYVAASPFVSGASDRLFYGDGKKLFSVPVVSSLSKGSSEFDMRIADPRFFHNFQPGSGVKLVGGEYSVSCGEHKVVMTLVDSQTAQPMIDAATYLPSPRKWRSHVLARDSHGIYYYVDRGRIHGTEGQYRLFVGPKGNLVQQKMTNIVSDSKGDIFSTKSGDLRLVIEAGGERNAKDGVWIKKEKPTTLTIVPIDANTTMIHNELGVYAGERLGTPCDDL